MSDELKRRRLEQAREAKRLQEETRRPTPRPAIQDEDFTNASPVRIAGQHVRVKITDVAIPFWTLLLFCLKLQVAMIVVGIIFSPVYVVLLLLLTHMM